MERSKNEFSGTSFDMRQEDVNLQIKAQAVLEAFGEFGWWFIINGNAF